MNSSSLILCSKSHSAMSRVCARRLNSGALTARHSLQHSRLLQLSSLLRKPVLPSARILIHSRLASTGTGDNQPKKTEIGSNFHPPPAEFFEEILQNNLGREEFHHSATNSSESSENEPADENAAIESQDSEAAPEVLESSESSDKVENTESTAEEISPTEVKDMVVSTYPHDEETAVPGITHYFDTFKIYSSLRYSGFTEGQADVIMRAIRGMLFERITECKEECTGSGGVDNEAYLFQAACSELRTEVQKMREMQSTEYGSNLARLQRDVEISQQEMNESMTTLKSSMDLDINDRKNSAREDESLVDLEIQEIHNKIAIEIISDLKSEIEALRWQTTRRGLAAVIFVASAVLVGISATKKEDKTHTAVVANKSDEGIAYTVPVLVPLAEDVTFDETIHVPSLESALGSDAKKELSSRSKAR